VRGGGEGGHVLQWLSVCDSPAPPSIQTFLVTINFYNRKFTNTVNLSMSNVFTSSDLQDLPKIYAYIQNYCIVRTRVRINPMSQKTTKQFHFCNVSLRQRINDIY